MKPLFSILSLLASLLLTYTAWAANQPASKKPISDEIVILNEVDVLASLLSDGVAGQGPEPKIVYGPGGDAFVLFDMESWGGSNSVTQYIAVFTKVDATGWRPEWSSHRYSLSALMKLGADQKDWEFQAEDLTVDRYDVVTVKGLTWAPRDAHCCPSIHKSIQIKYSDDSLAYLGPSKEQ